MRIILFLLLALLLPGPLATAGIFGNNMADDSFGVKSVGDGKAVVEGAPKDLKVGDDLYFVKSPFHFKVTAIEGNKVTVAVPSGSSLAVGNALLRRANPQIQKNIDTEKRLKKALEE
jgi:hypothetical protein